MTLKGEVAMDISKATCPGCGKPMQIHRLHCEPCGLDLDGDFEVSALARLTLEEQLFLTAFLRQHGNIRRMERLFGISYPTVKNRLNALAAKLDRQFSVPTPELQVLEQLERGEIDIEQALTRLDLEEGD
jgi:hypothetical protein